MTGKKFWVVAAAIFMLSTGVAYVANMTPDESSAQTLPASQVGQSTPAASAPATQTAKPSSGGTASQTKTYTMADVAMHGSASSCWTAINGKVYDVTSFINQHPGGPGAILSLCGTDGSSAFNAQHGGQRRPANELASFYIGDLAS